MAATRTAPVILLGVHAEVGRLALAIRSVAGWSWSWQSRPSCIRASPAAAHRQRPARIARCGQCGEGETHGAESPGSRNHCNTNRNARGKHFCERGRPARQRSSFQPESDFGVPFAGVGSATRGMDANRSEELSGRAAYRLGGIVWPIGPGRARSRLRQRAIFARQRRRPARVRPSWAWIRCRSSFATPAAAVISGASRISSTRSAAAANCSTITSRLRLRFGNSLLSSAALLRCRLGASPAHYSGIPRAGSSGTGARRTFRDPNR